VLQAWYLFNSFRESITSKMELVRSDLHEALAAEKVETGVVCLLYLLSYSRRGFSDCGHVRQFGGEQGTIQL
jgi:hypothetical protein